jgi:hypothetical protein
MRTNLAVSLFRGAIASACIASSLLAQVSSNSSTTPAFDPAFVVQPPTYGSTCLVGFIGDTTIAGGTAFDAASGRTMEVLASGASEFSSVCSIPSSFGGLGLAPCHEKRIVGSSWATWSHAYNGEIFWTIGATSATLTLPAGAGAYDCYIEPNPFSVNTFTVTGTASDASNVTINVTADGSAGASHFGFYTTGGCCLTSISITGPVDWAIGELRLGDCSGGIGTNYCTVNNNSTGFPALMGASGSADISVNNFTIDASQLPPVQFYIFFYGPNQVDIPFGNGRLCVGAPQTRLNPPQLSTAGGLASRLVNISGFVPGVKNFQCWFRDPPAGGAFFNTSDGLAVTFVP